MLERRRQPDKYAPVSYIPRTTTICPQQQTLLTVRLLVSSASTGTTENLGFATPIVSNEESPIVLDKCLLQLVFRMLVYVFLVVRNYRLCDGLSYGVDLGSVTSTANSDADIDIGELVKANDEKGFVDLRW
jgi:hypothetical protein